MQCCRYTRTYANQLTFATVKVREISSHNCDWCNYRCPYLSGNFNATFQNFYDFFISLKNLQGAGHTAPEYKPAECFAMFQRWISQIPL